MYEVGAGTEFLAWAMELTDILEKNFKTKDGAFFQAMEDKNLLIRKCEFYDGAEPSGNSIHTENLLRLYQITQNAKYLNQAEDILKAAKTFIQTFPPGACYHLISLMRYLDEKAPLVVFAFNKEESGKEEFEKALGLHFCPHTAVVWKNEKDDTLLKLIPSLKDKNCVDGKTTLYLCRGNHCEAPITEKDKIIEAIEHL